MDAIADFDEKLEVFFGEASDALARCYARLRGFERDGATLAGNLTGPSCIYAETLPAQFPLSDRGPGGPLLSEAVVPEPSFWTPEMPHLYRATVQLRHGPDMLASADRMFAFRALGVAGGKLRCQGKRWVLRGVRRDELGPPLGDWRAGDLVMVVRSPDDSLCMEASRVGVLIVAELDAPDVSEIQRLARWPAVAILALPSEATVDLRGFAHNLLLAASFTTGQTLAAPPWAQLVLFDVTPSEGLADRMMSCQLPIIATRMGTGTFSTIAGGRTMCDRLQQYLADRGDLAGTDFAGYIV